MKGDNMSNKLFRCTFVSIFVIIILLFPLIIYAVQPYEDDFQAIPQGSSQCGPTCFYMIFNHYEDHQIFIEDDCQTEVDLTEELSMVTKGTQICQWINDGSTSGTSWNKLKNAADGLCDADNCSRYYVSELNDEFTEYNDSVAEEERRIRLDYIIENYLEKNRPVIIHLRRYWWLWNHYAVLIGYNADDSLLYYADSNGGTIKTVDYDDFIEKKWYVSPDCRFYRARWDGEWMGFYHEQ